MNDLRLEVRVVLFTLQAEALQVLLLPDSSGWKLPEAPARADETLEESALRALQAKFARDEIYLEQLYTYGGEIFPDQPGLVNVIYFALTPLRPSLPQAREFSAQHLPPLCAGHEEIIAYALRRLRYKLEYSAAGFELLPEEFTLTQLQHTYEIILGEKLDKRNFRRRILQAGVIEETARRRSGEGRPARLYRYRPDAVAEVKTRRLFP